MLRSTQAAVRNTLRNGAWRTPTLTITRRFHASTKIASPIRPSRALLFGTVFATIVTTATLLANTVCLDAAVVDEPVETVTDPATQIEFPTNLTLPSKFPLPTFSLIGVGVRTVSFLRVKVYSVGFYADLSNPNLHIPQDATPEEKIEHIVKNTACVMRIVPTRSTSYGHLRDGFMRALQARVTLARQRGALTDAQEQEIQAPLRKLKSMFPSTPLSKHTPLDILLTGPSSNPLAPRSLVIRDMGAVESDWVGTEFILAYFEGDGLSPALKKSVVAKLDAKLLQ